MSFVGLVTQKDEPTGVSLMAKVVTANKKKSTKKVFDVSVKANSLNDFSCCVIDHATIVDKLNSLYDMSQIVDDITLIYSGIHDTDVSYRIIDTVSPILSNYLGEDGKIIERPKYGNGDATGFIEVTVSKGEAEITSRIQVSVKSITVEEVLSDQTFTQSVLWSLIRGQNDPYQQGSEWSGHNNISSKLRLISEKSIPELSDKPVVITWSVQDNTLLYANEIYTTPRINVETGEIGKCSYKEACTLVDNIPGITVKVIGSDNNILQNRVRIGGIVLTATLSISGSEVTKGVVFNCSTISKYLTSQEICDVVLANIHITTQQDKDIFYKSAGDSSFNTIIAPASGGTYTLKAFGNRGSETFEAYDLKLKVGDIISVSLTNKVLDFNGSNNYEDTAKNANLLYSAFNGGFQNDEGEIYSKLIINFDELKDATDTDKQFACGIVISISGYSSSGDTPGGSPLMIQRYAQIKIDTSAMN